MKISDVAALCGVSRGTIREWIKHRGFPDGKRAFVACKRGAPALEWDANDVAQWLHRNGAHDRADNLKRKNDEVVERIFGTIVKKEKV
jgi:predicted DNA-binding transcriptional regulator AlpA